MKSNPSGIFRISYYQHGEKLWKVKVGKKQILTEQVILFCSGYTIIKDNKAYLTGTGIARMWTKRGVIIYGVK